MKQLNADCLALCRMQALVFEGSVKLECGSAVFIRRYMNSGVAHRMDADGFMSGSISPESVIAEVESEYGSSSYGSVKYSAEELHWMGYLYRYWVFRFGMSSASVYKAIGANELRSLFFAYHSLDPEQAIFRIAESKGLILEEDPIAKGVAALKRIREKGSFEYYFVHMQ